MYWPVNILRNLAMDNSPTNMVFLTDVYCIDWLLIIDRCIGRWTSYGTSPWTTLLRYGVPHRCVLYWLIIDYWLPIGVLAGELPAEPRPGQLSHRHGVPHRRVLYWLIIDYWLLIIDRCTGWWTSCRTSPWTTLPPTWCSSQTCTVLSDYWLLIIDRCTGVNILRNLALDNSPTDMVFLTDVYCIDWLLIIDYW